MVSDFSASRVLNQVTSKGDNMISNTNNILNYYRIPIEEWENLSPLVKAALHARMEHSLTVLRNMEPYIEHTDMLIEEMAKIIVELANSHNDVVLQQRARELLIKIRTPHPH